MADEKILIVEDEKLLRWSMKEKLSKVGYEVFEAGTLKDAESVLDKSNPDMVILDLRLPDGEGTELLQKISKDADHIGVIMLTVVNSADVAVKALKLGALDYLSKPVDDEKLQNAIRESLDKTRLRRHVAHFLRMHEREYSFVGMLGVSPPMKKTFDTILKIAMSPSTTVLITGESGTGKELAARALHKLSDRKNKPFVTINCSSLTETLIESELYGHEKGAFTDAKVQKKGIFEIADKGTVFLDEIGDISQSMQVKLLRIIEEKTFMRVGGFTDISVDVRIITATNRSLDTLVEEEKFRPDLFYRLNVARIYMPPVRKRGEDVIFLAEYFLDRFNKKFQKNFGDLSQEVRNIFSNYEWPGNVREIRNVIERAVLLYDDDILRPEHLEIGGEKSPGTEDGFGFNSEDEGFSLEEMEKAVLLKALEKTGQNQSEAARLLKISRDTLRYRMKRHNLL